MVYAIGSMVPAIYGNIYHQYTPFMLANIPYMDPMGMPPIKSCDFGFPPAQHLPLFGPRNANPWPNHNLVAPKKLPQTDV